MMNLGGTKGHNKFKASLIYGKYHMFLRQDCGFGTLFC